MKEKEETKSKVEVLSKDMTKKKEKKERDKGKKMKKEGKEKNLRKTMTD